MRWWDQTPWALCRVLSFKAALSLSSFIVIRKLFSASSPPAIRVLSPADLRLFIFLLAILIPVGRKAMTNLDSVLRRRDITLPTKVHIVKALFFQASGTDVRIGP